MNVMWLLHPVTRVRVRPIEVRHQLLQENNFMIGRIVTKQCAYGSTGALVKYIKNVGTLTRRFQGMVQNKKVSQSWLEQ